MKPNRPYIVLILCFVMLAAMASRISFAQTVRKILILPFQIHAEKDLAFLKKGIGDMLSSRLAQEGKVVLINPAEAIGSGLEPTGAQQAIALGKKVGADDVVFGSLTLFGESISIDVRLIDVQSQKPVVTFNRSGKSHDEVILYVNQFAEKVNTEVFGRKAEAVTPQPEAVVVDPSRRHPEKVYKESDGMGGEYSYETPDQLSRRDFSIWRSRNFPMHISGMAVGDIDGDGKNETVFISEEMLLIYRFIKGKFQKVSEYKGKENEAFIGVDVADINQNGRAEIFVTAQDGQPWVEDIGVFTRNLRSFVVEWDGARLTKIVDKQNWYYRVIREPKKDPVLMGQRRGIKGLFSGGVYFMLWQNGGYEAVQRLKLPRGVKVFGFTTGDVMNDGQEMILSFTSEEYLQVHSREMDSKWKSSRSMGGSGVYFEISDESSTRGSVLAGVPETEYYYILPRIHVADMEGDGLNEVIVVNNRDSMGKAISRFRVFKSGYIECLAWDQLGLYTKWKTRKVSGYISDYTVADFDNDGRPELVFSVDTNLDPFSSKSIKSYLVSWKLKQKAKK